MRALLVLLPLLALACTSVPDGPQPRSGGACSIDGLGHLVGRPATAELGAKALRLSGARALRWIRPGDMVTMDFREDRLNAHLDAEGRTERFGCG
jgi:hypothetical protein